MRLTQEEMAGFLKIDRTTYRNIETGDTKMLSPHLAPIAEILQTSVFGLVSGYFTSITNTAGTLDDVSARYQQKIDESRKEFENVQTELLKRIKSLEKENESLREWLSDSRDLNAMYKKSTTRSSNE